jgi:hypothetical protein
LDNKGYWGLVEQCWNNYFKLYPDDSSRRQFIELLCFALEPNWRIAPRSVMRTRWQQMTQRVFQARGLLSKGAFWEGIRERSLTKHPSPLVRFFGRSFHFNTDSCDVFLTLYAFKRPESAAVKKPHDVEHMERALQPKGDDEESSSADE